MSTLSTDLCLAQQHGRETCRVRLQHLPERLAILVTQAVLKHQQQHPLFHSCFHFSSLDHRVKLYIQTSAAVPLSFLFTWPLSYNFIYKHWQQQYPLFHYYYIPLHLTTVVQLYIQTLTATIPTVSLLLHSSSLDHCRTTLYTNIDSNNTHCFITTSFLFTWLLLYNFIYKHWQQQYPLFHYYLIPLHLTAVVQLYIQTLTATIPTVSLLLHSSSLDCCHTTLYTNIDSNNTHCFITTSFLFTWLLSYNFIYKHWQQQYPLFHYYLIPLHLTAVVQLYIQTLTATIPTVSLLLHSSSLDCCHTTLYTNIDSNNTHCFITTSFLFTWLLSYNFIYKHWQQQYPLFHYYYIPLHLTAVVQLYIQTLTATIPTVSLLLHSSSLDCCRTTLYTNIDSNNTHCFITTSFLFTWLLSYNFIYKHWQQQYPLFHYYFIPLHLTAVVQLYIQTLTATIPTVSLLLHSSSLDCCRTTLYTNIDSNNTHCFITTSFLFTWLLSYNFIYKHWQQQYPLFHYYFIPLHLTAVVQLYIQTLTATIPTVSLLLHSSSLDCCRTTLYTNIDSNNTHCFITTSFLFTWLLSYNFIYKHWQQQCPLFHYYFIPLHLTAVVQLYIQTLTATIPTVSLLLHSSSLDCCRTTLYTNIDSNNTHCFITTTFLFTWLLSYNFIYKHWQQQCPLFHYYFIPLHLTAVVQLYI